MLCVLCIHVTYNTHMWTYAHTCNIWIQFFIDYIFALTFFDVFLGIFSIMSHSQLLSCSNHVSWLVYISSCNGLFLPLDMEQICTVRGVAFRWMLMYMIHHEAMRWVGIWNAHGPLRNQLLKGCYVYLNCKVAENKLDAVGENINFFISIFIKCWNPLEYSVKYQRLRAYFQISVMKTETQRL